MAGPSLASAAPTASPSRVFRFLDLPAEMRNPYQEALTHHRIAGSTANTALLRVCKQIYSEAKGIRDAESTFSIVTSAEQALDNDGVSDGNCTLKISGNFQLTRDKDITLDAFCDATPETIFNVKNIHVQIQMPDSNGLVREYWRLHCYIYGLLDSLCKMPPHTRSNLTVTIKDYKPYNEYSRDGHKVVLYSFSKLPLNCNITIEGSHLEQQFHTVRTKYNAGADTILPKLYRLRPVIKKLVSQESLAVPSGDPWLDGVFDAAKPCARFVEDAVGDAMRGWMSPSNERNNALALAIVRMWLKIRQKGFVEREDVEKVNEYIRDFGEEQPDDLKFWALT